MTAGRVPAQDLEAEEAVLGAVMAAERMLDPVVGEIALEPGDFYRERHRLIFAAIRELRDRDEPIDALTVSDALSRRGELEQAGGRQVVSGLASTVPVAGNARHYAGIVKRLALQRQKHAIGVGLTNGMPPAEGIEQLVALRAAEGTRFRVRTADLSRARRPRWAWSRRLPLGYLALLLGAEGVGKGTLSAWVIARLTRGQLPGDLEGTPSRVLLIGDEDSFDSVIAPRLYVAGADLELVEILDEQDGDLLDLRRDAGELRALLERHEYRLLYIDALLDTLGVGVDDWRAKDVRDALRPLRRAVMDLDVCALAALHPNKGKRDSFRDLLSGSHAFNASSRSSLLLAPHPDPQAAADGRRVLVRGKGNLSAEPQSFEFSVESRDVEVNGDGFSLPLVVRPSYGDLTAAEVLGADTSGRVRDELAEEIEALGASSPGRTWSRSELARAVDRDPADGSVGRALTELESRGAWEKVSRGKWRAIPTVDEALNGHGGQLAAPFDEEPFS